MQSVGFNNKLIQNQNFYHHLEEDLINKKLPNEILRFIFSLLKEIEKVNNLTVCKHWKVQIIRSEFESKRRFILDIHKFVELVKPYFSKENEKVLENLDIEIKDFNLIRFKDLELSQTEDHLIKILRELCHADLAELHNKVFGICPLFAQTILAAKISKIVSPPFLVNDPHFITQAATEIVQSCGLSRALKFAVSYENEFFRRTSLKCIVEVMMQKRENWNALIQISQKYTIKRAIGDFVAETLKKSNFEDSLEMITSIQDEKIKMYVIKIYEDYLKTILPDKAEELLKKVGGETII